MSRRRPGPSRRPVVHFWIPNAFEFKGGIQVYVQDLLGAVARQQTTASIVVYDKLDRGKGDTNIDGMEFVFCGGAPARLRTIWFAARLVVGALRQRPSLVVSCHINHGPVAFGLHRLIGLRYWLVAHGVDAWGVSDRWRRAAIAGAERVLPVSSVTAERMLAEHPRLGRERVSLLPCTFDPERFAPGPRPAALARRLGFGDDDPVVLTVARLAASEGYKGHDSIIAAMTRVRAHYRNARYVIVGDGDDRDRLAELASTTGVSEGVKLVGRVPDADLPEYYRLCDVFAMPSTGEGFGIVFLEALACGKPALGGSRDGARDALADGELGTLVDAEDSDAIAEALVAMLGEARTDGEAQRGEHRRAEVIRRFGPAAFERRVADLFLPELSDDGDALPAR